MAQRVGGAGGETSLLRTGFVRARVMPVAAGVSFSMVASETGAAAVWGGSAFGEATVPPMGKVVSLAGGDFFLLALDEFGAVHAWGRDVSDETSVPAMIGAKQLAAGSQHALALQYDGSVVGWGNDAAGQATVPGNLPPVTVVAAGGDHSLVLLADRTLQAWGRNAEGQTSIPMLATEWVAIGAGYRHSLAVAIDGTVAAWGDNIGGQCDVPAGMDEVVAVAGGAQHSLALQRDGRVVAWGDNAAGQCDVPSGLGPVAAIAAGAQHSVAVLMDGSVVAWGDDVLGQSTVMPGLAGVIPPLEAPVISPENRRFGEGLNSVPVTVFCESAGAALYRASDPAATAVDWTATGTEFVVEFVAQEVVAVAAVRDGVERIAQDAHYSPARWKVAAIGGEQGAVITEEGWLDAWGRNDYGQLNGESERTVPFVQVDGGTDFLVGLRSDGVVRSWGYATYGSISVPGDLTDIKQIAAGPFHALALRRSGHVRAWGYDGSGRTNVPANLGRVVNISAGGAHNLVIREDGTMASWGYDSHGQVSQTPGGQAVAIAAGAEHSLAIRPDGTLLAWGRNTEGQCTVPAGLGPVRAIDAGSRFSVALLEDGTVVCWGDNTYQQLWVPTGLADVVSIDAGFNSTTAVQSDGSIVFWGRTTDTMITSYIGPYPDEAVVPPLAGPVLTPGSGIGPWLFPLTGNAGVETRGAVVRYAFDGDIPTASSPVLRDLELREGGILTCRSFGADGEKGPIAVSLGAYADSRLITAGQNFHVAVTPSGAAVAWGQGYGDAPVTLTGFEDLVQVAGGYGFVLGLDRDGAVHGWGDNGNGQLDVPADLEPVIGIAAGINHSVALSANGTVRAWGSPSGGATAVPAGLNEVIEVSAGSTHSLALGADGRVVAWGSGPQAEVPPTLRGVVAVSAGWDHSLALRADGTVVGWGNDSSGQATPPAGLVNVVAIAAGSGTSLALKNDGTLVAWGIHVSPPTDLAGVRQIAVFSFGNGMALQADGTVVVWGDNSAGQTAGVPAYPLAVPEVARPRGVRDGGVVHLFCGTPGAGLHLDFAGGVPDVLSDSYSGPVAPTAPLDLAVRPEVAGAWGALRDLSTPATSVSFEDWVAGLGLPTGRDHAEDQNGATGIRNLLAYGLGRSPLDLAVGELPGMVPSVVDPIAEVYRFTASTTLRGAAMVVQEGSDLTGWETVPTGAWTRVQAGDDHDVYEVALPPEPRPENWFIRVGVVEAP